MSVVGRPRNLALLDSMLTALRSSALSLFSPGYWRNGGYEFFSITFSARIFYHSFWIPGILFVFIVLGLLQGTSFGRRPEGLYRCLRTSILGQHLEKIFHRATRLIFRSKQQPGRLAWFLPTAQRHPWLLAVSPRRKCHCLFFKAFNSSLQILASDRPIRSKKTLSGWLWCGCYRSVCAVRFG